MVVIECETCYQGVDRTKYWRQRSFALIWFGYFSFYLCRYNMPVAVKPMRATYGWSATDTGAILTALTALYAFGQFVNGQLGDRFGTRVMVSLGAYGSVFVNLIIFIGVSAVTDSAGFGGLLVLVAILWGLNGFLQSMGWSLMVKAMTMWFPRKGRGRVMGAAGTCYQFGAAVATLLAILITGQDWPGSWHDLFWLPALLLAIMATGFFMFFANRPEDVGLEPTDQDTGVEHEREVELTEDQRRVDDKVMSPLQNLLVTLQNPSLWIIAWAFFLLDVNRYGFVNWLPAYLDTRRTGDHSGDFVAENFKLAVKVCVHPLAGSVGAILGGWATDKYFKGRRAPVISFFLIMNGIFSFVFTTIPADNTAGVTIVVALIGFSTYGAHVLMVGHAAADFGRKSHAAGAAGFIDGLGYVGASLTGVGAGAIIDWGEATGEDGYAVTFMVAGGCALLGALIMIPLWNKGHTEAPVVPTQINVGSGDDVKEPLTKEEGSDSQEETTIEDVENQDLTSSQAKLTV